MNDEKERRLEEIADELQKLLAKLRQLSLNRENRTKESNDNIDEMHLEQIRQLLIRKSREGKTFEIKELLKIFNAEKLSDVLAEDYDELLNMAEKL